LDEHDKRFEAIDRRFDTIDEKLKAHDKRFEAIEKKLAEHGERFGIIDSRFNQTITFLTDIDRRIENIVETIATHTGMLKDITFRVIAIERHMKSNTQYAQSMDSEVGLLCERVHQLEEKTGTLSMLRDKGKRSDRYKYKESRF
jgi:chromosome segregation ATPase